MARIYADIDDELARRVMRRYGFVDQAGDHRSRLATRLDLEPMAAIVAGEPERPYFTWTATSTRSLATRR